jgi:RNA polymerase sigma-70 factor (ECF subfamily)
MNDDRALIEGMTRGDERALATLYDRYSSAVLGLVMRIVPERADAESVLLEAFAQAWRDAYTFTAARGSVLSWLFTIARSRALDAARASGRRAKYTPLSVDDAPGEALTALDAHSDPSFGVESDEQQVAVAKALGTLPGPQRTAIELAFFEGLSHVEIAERLAEPLGTVKTRIRLGMIKLRELLRPYAGEMA